MDDSQFTLLGVVPGDVEGAVRQVALWMWNAHILERVTNDGTVIVSASTNGDLVRCASSSWTGNDWPSS